MSVQMNIAEAKAKLSELVARAEAGEEVVIARDGKPVVVMRPANESLSKRKRPIGFLSHFGSVWSAPDAAEPAPDDEAAQAESLAPGDPLGAWRR